jgi:hypothetical protein
MHSRTTSSQGKERGPAVPSAGREGRRNEQKKKKKKLSMEITWIKGLHGLRNCCEKKVIGSPP